MTKLIEALDDYGWANTDELRRKALMAWMQRVTTTLALLESRSTAALDRSTAALELTDRLEATLIARGTP